MNPALIARRAVQCTGMACLYSFMERSHSYYKFKVDDQHSQNLNMFRKNIAEEAAEILEKLNQNLYSELEKIHRQSMSKDEMSVWMNKLLQESVPAKLSAVKKHKEINDQLRVVPRDQLESSTRLTNHSERLKNNSEAALKHLMNEFYQLENEVILVFTTKQKQVSKVIESYRTKVFIETPENVYDHWLFVPQLTACYLFSKLFQHLWVIPPAQLIVHEKKLPKYGKLLFGSLLFVAYLMSEDEKEVNDYHLDTAYAAADLPMPQFPRLPSQQFGGITPVVYQPLQTVEDRFTLKFFEDKALVNVLMEGFVFRKFLFNSLLLFSSSRTSHLCTAAAASVVACLREATEESYHAVTEDEGMTAYVAEKTLSHNVSFSVPFKPLLLQAMLFASGNWHVVVAVDLLMCLKEIKNDASWDDDVWVLFRTSEVYGVACHLVAFTDWASSPVIRFLDKLKGGPPKHEKLSGKIIDRYRKILQQSGDSQGYFTTEDMISLEKSMLYFSQTMHLPMKTLIPKPFDPSAAKPDSLSNPPESQMLENIYGVDNDSLARVHAFMEDSERTCLNNYFSGKVDFDDAKFIVRECITDKTWVEDRYDHIEEKYIKRVLFWDEEATEENVLDLLQEFYEFILAKRVLYAEDFIYVQGRAYMMDLECELELTDNLMTEYYQHLDRWLLHAVELEEINFLNRYGLTKHKLQAIASRRVTTKELSTRWETYFNAKEYHDMIKKKADPIPVYRAVIKKYT